jgi:hypothetical protein
VLVELEEGVFIRTSADAGLETEEELEEAL